MNSHEVTPQEIKLFNEVREKYRGTELSTRTITDILVKELRYPKGDGRLLKALTSGVNPPIVRIARGKYIFSKMPVFIERLQTAFADKIALSKAQKLSSGNKTKSLFTVEQAIQLLKSKGYKVYKPIIEYKEL